LFERLTEPNQSEAVFLPKGPILDLRPHFNARLEDDWQNPADRGNNLSLLGRGEYSVGAITWWIEGIVQLGSAQINRGSVTFPERIGPISLSGTCSALYFLHGAGWSDPNGTVVARYVVTYRDGQRMEIPVRYGQEVANWQYDANTPPVVSGAGRVAWRGTQLRWAANPGLGIRLYRMTWTNPRPHAERDQLELVSANQRTAVFLLAVSASR
jgi:hypothetical protein